MCKPLPGKVLPPLLPIQIIMAKEYHISIGGGQDEIYVKLNLPHSCLKQQQSGCFVFFEKSLPRRSAG